MNNKKAVCKLFYLLEGYKTEIIAILICLIASTGLNLCIPLLSRLIMDKGFIGGNKKLLIELVFATMSIYLVTFIIDLFKEKRRIDIMINIQYSLQKKSFLHLARMKMEYFKDKNCAEIMNNISCDIGNISSIADEGFFFVITKVFCMLGGIIGLFIIDYRMTILVLIFVPVKYILMRYLAKQENLLMEEFISDEQEYASWFGDTFGGILEVKLFNLFDNKYEEFIKKQDKVLQKQKCMSLLNQFNNFIDTIVIQLLITMIYVIGSNLVFDMDLSIGSIFAFITYSTYVTEL